MTCLLGSTRAGRVLASGREHNRRLPLLREAAHIPSGFGMRITKTEQELHQRLASIQQVPAAFRSKSVISRTVHALHHAGRLSIPLEPC